MFLKKLFLIVFALSLFAFSGLVFALTPVPVQPVATPLPDGQCECLYAYGVDSSGKTCMPSSEACKVCFTDNLHPPDINSPSVQKWLKDHGCLPQDTINCVVRFDKLNPQYSSCPSNAIENRKCGYYKQVDPKAPQVCRGGVDCASNLECNDVPSCGCNAPRQDLGCKWSTSALPYVPVVCESSGCLKCVPVGAPAGQTPNPQNSVCACFGVRPVTPVIPAPTASNNEIIFAGAGLIGVLALAYFMHQRKK